MTSPPSSPLAEEAYEAIEAAVMETSRGRWFLAEYARRNRHADTLAVLAALERLERMVRRDRSAELNQGVRIELLAMATALERLRSELTSLRSGQDGTGRLGDVGDDLDGVVAATEAATQDILAAAERVQETAWVLREQGIDPTHCDGLDQRATEIYLACSFQDLTGQRIGRVVATLRDIEARIRSVLESTGLDVGTPAKSAVSVRPSPTLSNEPVHGDALVQTAVDDMIAQDTDLFEASETPQALPVEVDHDEIIFVPSPSAPIPRVMGALALAPEPLPQDRPVPVVRINFADLSFAEKAALFS
jgi:chemotaxis regulatin CheY-phosphate phosphatase CheZ